MTSYLDDFYVDVETKQVLDLALEMTRTALGLADDFANGIIAKRIIELARAGERHPGRLCEGALKNLRGHFCSETNQGGSSKRPGSVGLQMLTRGASPRPPLIMDRAGPDSERFEPFVDIARLFAAR
jgi:hypothetical protein